MVGFELFGITLVILSIIISFYKGKDRMALSLIVVLLVLFLLAGYFDLPNIT